MEIFVLICLAIVAAVVFFWLFVFPAGLLVGAAVSILGGIKAGLKTGSTPRSPSGSTP